MPPLAAVAGRDVADSLAAGPAAGASRGHARLARSARSSICLPLGDDDYPRSAAADPGPADDPLTRMGDPRSSTAGHRDRRQPERHPAGRSSTRTSFARPLFGCAGSCIASGLAARHRCGRASRRARGPFVQRRRRGHRPRPRVPRGATASSRTKSRRAASWSPSSPLGTPPVRGQLPAPQPHHQRPCARRARRRGRDEERLAHHGAPRRSSRAATCSPIPGSIHSPLSKGCHWLIKQGAKLVESADDVLAELAAGAPPAPCPKPRHRRAGPRRPAARDPRAFAGEPRRARRCAPAGTRLSARRRTHAPRARRPGRKAPGRALPPTCCTLMPPQRARDGPQTLAL